MIGKLNFMICEMIAFLSISTIF